MRWKTHFPTEVPSKTETIHRRGGVRACEGSFQMVLSLKSPFAPIFAKPSKCQWGLPCKEGRWEKVNLHVLLNTDSLDPRPTSPFWFLTFKATHSISCHRFWSKPPKVLKLTKLWSLTLDSPQSIAYLLKSPCTWAGWSSILSTWDWFWELMGTYLWVNRCLNQRQILKSVPLSLCTEWHSGGGGWLVLWLLNEGLVQVAQVAFTTTELYPQIKWILP